MENSFKILFAAVVFSSITAWTASAGEKIEFSEPEKEAKPGFSNMSKRFSNPLNTVGPGSVSDKLNANQPNFRMNVPQNAPAPRSSDIENADKKKNWIFATPDDRNPDEAFSANSKSNNDNEKKATLLEKFLQGDTSSTSTQTTEKKKNKSGNGLDGDEQNSLSASVPKSKSNTDTQPATTTPESTSPWQNLLGRASANSSGNDSLFGSRSDIPDRDNDNYQRDTAASRRTEFRQMLEPRSSDFGGLTTDPSRQAVNPIVGRPNNFSGNSDGGNSSIFSAPTAGSLSPLPGGRSVLDGLNTRYSSPSATTAVIPAPEPFRMKPQPARLEAPKRNF